MAPSEKKREKNAMIIMVDTFFLLHVVDSDPQKIKSFERTPQLLMSPLICIFILYQIKACPKGLIVC